MYDGSGFGCSCARFAHCDFDGRPFETLMAIPGRGRGTAARPGVPLRPVPKVAFATRPATPIPVTIPRTVFARSRIRYDLYQRFSIPDTGTSTLSNLAAYAFQHYALFVWLVTHPQPRYLDGPTTTEITSMINEANKKVLELEDKGPSSIALALKGGYTENPLNDKAVERMVLLALIAERPKLLPQIFQLFPETRDPIRLSALLRPYLDSHVERYQDSYANPGPKGGSGISATLPESGILKAIAALGKVRLLQNIMLRDMIRVRYAMITIMADPYVFGTSSLGEIKSIISKIDTTLAANTALYIPLLPAINTLKSNFDEVQNVLSTGAAITQDALRRLRLLLGVLNASDSLFDKMAKTSS